MPGRLTQVLRYCEAVGVADYVDSSRIVIRDENELVSGEAGIDIYNLRTRVLTKTPVLTSAHVS